MTWLHGQPRVVERIREFLVRPVSRPFLFFGPEGTGKTMAAHYLANSLNVDQTQINDFRVLTPVDQPAKNIRTISTSFRKRTLDLGWRCLIIDECDVMRPATVTFLLGFLDRLPSQLIVVFTTREPDKLKQAFRNRCDSLEFVANPSDVHEFVASEWCKRVPDRPLPASLKAAGCQPNCSPSYRLALKDLEYTIDHPNDDPRMWIVHDGSLVIGCFHADRRESAEILQASLSNDEFPGGHFYLARSRLAKRGGLIPSDVICDNAP